MHRKYKIPYLMNVLGFECGYRTHSNSASMSVRDGALMNDTVLIILGFVVSLVNSLIASANGCGIPDSITLFGPLRN